MTTQLSIIIVYYNIPRQARKTLYSVLPPYQLGITKDEVEVIIVDNGSHKDIDIKDFIKNGYDIKVIRIQEPEPSPAKAINIGLNASCGHYVGVMIDGARIASPGILIKAKRALGANTRAIVGSRGRYLGPKPQRRSIHEGYSEKAEEWLLSRIDWANNGYEMFRISVSDESSGKSFFDPISESNSIFMSRHLWQELDGYSESFKFAGGGYVNLDTWRRACLLQGSQPVILIGEATFHQLHGGVATEGEIMLVDQMHREYIQIRGLDYSIPDVNLEFYGGFAKPFIENIPFFDASRYIAYLMRAARD